MRIDIYSDTVCPWCYLGKRRFELALAQRPRYEPRVTWRPFELNPELPSEGVVRAAYLACKLGDAAAVAEMEATVSRHGEAVGLQSPVQDRVMRAYFEQGVDEREAQSALILRAGQDGVVAAERHAAVLGISGVPTYVFDGQYTLSGAQEPPAMAKIFDQVAEFAAGREATS